MKRIYPSRPIIGVGGVIIKDNNIVLIKRGTPPGYGKWSIPGGVVRWGESLNLALIREIKEEIGIKIKVEEIIDVVDRIYLDKKRYIKYHYIVVDYLCFAKNGKLLPASDVLEANWVPISELPYFKIPLKAKAIIKKAKEMYETISFSNKMS